VLGPNAVVPVNGAVAGFGLASQSERAWSFLCPSGSSSDWVGVYVDPEDPSVTTADGACPGGAHPTRAKIAFSLDPWGRVDTSPLVEAFTKQYNVRWDQLAVNLVGTAVKDCQLAADALTCYSSSYVP